LYQDPRRKKIAGYPHPENHMFWCGIQYLFFVIIDINFVEQLDHEFLSMKRLTPNSEDCEDYSMYAYKTTDADAIDAFALTQGLPQQGRKNATPDELDE